MSKVRQRGVRASAALILISIFWVSRATKGTSEGHLRQTKLVIERIADLLFFGIEHFNVSSPNSFNNFV